MEQENGSVTNVEEEPFLGTIDYILIVVLLAAAYWYLFKRQKKEDASPARSYSIQ